MTEVMSGTVCTLVGTVGTPGPAAPIDISDEAWLAVPSADATDVDELTIVVMTGAFALICETECAGITAGRGGRGAGPGVAGG